MNKKNVKILIGVLVVVALVVVIIIANTKKKHKLEEYVKVNYDYFVMYSKDDKVGVIDKNGNVILEPKYFDVFIPNPSKDVFLAYESANNYVILNSKGEKLFKDYENVQALQTSQYDLDFEKVFLTFEKNGKFGVIDFLGNQIIPAEYDSIESLKFRPGELLVKKNDKYGVIGATGDLKLEIKYDSIIRR